MKLVDAWEKREEWDPSYIIPRYNRKLIKKNTLDEPIWLHFGAGNIFRSFIANVMDRLIEADISNKGIIVCEDFDKELVYKAYEPYDSLSLLVTLKASGSIEKKVVGSVVQAVTCEERMRELFRMPSIQLVSFTITEKGYSGQLMRKIAEFCLERYKAGKYPIALVSMDNCAHNGEILSKAIINHANTIINEGLAEPEFLQYLQDESKVTFPWSMIDKITPRPDSSVKAILEKDGFEDTEQIITSFNTYTAPFVNAEETEYLVIEDSFPNGRPILENAGVLFTDRETVDKIEKMKVGTCLNPLHTALAVFGCLLGYETIHEEMNDKCLKKLVWNLGYVEGMPAVINPGIMQPEKFLNDVLTLRLPNPFMPDTPQRIATDTSQKIPVRFGQTLKTYSENPLLKIENLRLIPLVFAAWLRYLLGVDDNGVKFTLSPDPRMDELTKKLAGISLGDQIIDETAVDSILSDKSIFVIDLYKYCLADISKSMFLEMLAGKGAVRNTLGKYVQP